MSSILYLDFILIGALYPLFFFCHTKDVVDPDFYRFNIGMAYVPAGVVLLILWFQGIPEETKILIGIWMVLALAVTAVSWKREIIRDSLFIVPATAGLLVLVAFQRHVRPMDAGSFLASVLGGLLLCASIYAVVLGHWYLSVQKLSIRPLRNAARVLVALLVLRLIWDAYAFAFRPVVFEGDMLIPMSEYLQTYEGFLLWIALIFGTVFPLIVGFFVLGTVKIESTQSATGLLYVVLISMLMGELAYKYYLIRYGLAL
ncbi:MAG: hypothetical protein AAB229_05130 [Candidatus Hydrogenedentota bacterium]